MKLNLNQCICFGFLLFGMMLSTNTTAQSACCSKDKVAETAACKPNSEKTTTTSGCTPSACRGAKTKFGEAKVISTLRTNLIELKAEMEQSTHPKFEGRSYDIHGIIGETDEESLAIIVQEVQLVEQAFAKKTDLKSSVFTLPENKAKQVQYLNARIDALKQFLKLL